MNAWAFIAVGCGAAMGAWARWALGLWLNHLNPAVPLGTLVANVGGGYAIGLAMGWFAANPGVSFWPLNDRHAAFFRSRPRA